MSEELWRRDTVWSLSRAVDALARRGKLKDLREAVGILAYADAFQKTLLLYRRRQEDPFAFEPNAVTYRYDFDHIRESLKVQLDHVNSRRSTLSQMLVSGLAGCIAATALLVSAISAFNGAVGQRINDATVQLGINRDVLQYGSDFWPVPAFCVGVLFWLVSSQVLSEDRIGAEKRPRRKIAQAIRGIFNTIAKRLGWDGLGVQRALMCFYIVLLAALMVTTYYGAPRALAVGRYLSSLEIVESDKKPSRSGRTTSDSEENSPRPSAQAEEPGDQPGPDNQAAASAEIAPDPATTVPEISRKSAKSVGNSPDGN